MKTLLMALLCAAALLLAGTAHAYAIFSHVDQKACVATGDDTCDFTVNGHSTHNGEHGAGLDNAKVAWKKDGHCYTSDHFNIPKGGFIRIYENEVKVYDHQNKHLRSTGIHRVKCDSSDLFDNLL